MDAKTNEPDNSRLLSDEDFVRLMEAEHSQIKTPVNEWEKQQVWQGIRRNLRSKPRPWLPILLVAAALGLVILPLARQREGLDQIQLKGPVEGLEVALSAYTLANDQSMQAVQAPKVGQTLVFKVSSPTSAYLALILQKNGEAPELSFRTPEAVAGQDLLLGGAGQVFAYTLDKPGESLQFCVIAAHEASDLDHMIQNIKQNWSERRTSSCQLFDVR